MYQRILVPLDGSATSEYALDEAIKFAQQQNAQIKLVHVLEDILYFDNEDCLNYSELVDSMRRNGEKILQQAQNKFQQVGITALQNYVKPILASQAMNSQYNKKCYNPCEIHVLIIELFFSFSKF